MVILVLILGGQISHAQGIGISESSIIPDASAILELRHSSGSFKGFLAPRMTTANRTGIGSPATGLMVYDTDVKSIFYYDGGWIAIPGGTSILGVANGGTGSSSQNWVDLTTGQTAAGAKIWSNLGTFNAGITSTGGAVNLNASSNFATNINTGTSTGAIALGNAASTGITLQAGTGNYSLDGTAASTYTMGTSTTTGTISIGGAAQTGAITLGSSSGIQILNLGTGAGAATVNIATGVTNAKTIALGTGAAMANTISIGGTGANIITIGNTQTAGSISFGGAMTTGTIDIGNSSAAMTGTINIGGSTGLQALNLGGGNTGAKTISIGNGTAGNTISIANGVNASPQTINIGAGASAANNSINIGSGTNTAGVTAITIGTNTNFANTTLIEGGNGAGAITMTPQTTGTIVIGAAAGTGAITLGASSAAQTVNVGTGTGASTVNIATGATNAKTINIGTGAIANTILIGNTTAGTNTGINVAASTAQLHIGPGTAVASEGAPLKFTSGTNLTVAEAGAVEYDGVNTYVTNETTSGRGAIPVEQHFKITGAVAAIGPAISNFFGATSNISLVPNGIYEIDIYCWFLKTTLGSVTWTFTNSAAPTSQDITYEATPNAGLLASPGLATKLDAQFFNNVTAVFAPITTGNLTNGANHYAHFKIFLINGGGTSLKIQATESAGTITPGIGSRWYCKRLPAGNVGTFAN